MKRRLDLVFAAALLCTLVCVRVNAATQATIFEAFPTFVDGLDPSTRSAGMGGASGAVFWGDLANHWANPALLGFTSGVRYTSDITSILSDGDFDFDTRETSAGFGGIGVSLEGQPFSGLGKRELDLHSQFGTAYTPAQDVTIYQHVRSWGAGASLAGVLADVARLRHREAPAFARRVDIAAGFSEKVIEAGITGSSGYRHRGVSRDAGVLLRTGTTLERAGDAASPLRLDASYGFSIVGSGDGHVDVNPIERHVRHALAARASLESHPEGRRMLPLWLAPAFAPLLSLGLAFDHEQITAPGAAWDNHTVRHYGAELGITRALAFQIGTSQSGGGSAFTTWGLDVALPFGRIGGLRYGYARTGSPDWHVPHDSWSVWLDPLAIARREH